MPKKIICTAGTLEYLSNLHKHFENISHKTLQFDFFNTSYIDKKMLGVLGLIFTKLKSKNNDIRLLTPSKEISELLIMSGFLEKFPPPNNNVPKHLIPYKTFNGDDTEDFGNYLYEKMSDLDNCELITFLKPHIMEIFLNIKTHARKNKNKSKYAGKEVFSSGYIYPDHSHLMISISNNGKTFKETIYQKTLIEYEHQYEYIRWALKANNSTTENRPGGAGLAMLKDLIDKSRGSLLICSGNAFYSYSYELDGLYILTKDLSAPYPGTCICIDIPLSNDYLEPNIDITKEYSIIDLLN